MRNVIHSIGVFECDFDVIVKGVVVTHHKFRFKDLLILV